MKKLFWFLILYCIYTTAVAQTSSYYWVAFKNKNNSIYQISNPLQFLSQRAIDRRIRQNIPISSQDFPVNSWFVDSLQQAGATIVTTSRWHNGATISVTDTNILQQIRNLSFVNLVQRTKKGSGAKGNSGAMVIPVNNHQKSTVWLDNFNPATRTRNTFNYGYGYQQISMIKGDYLHQMGFSGEGMLIGVIDAGFFHADVLPVFDSLWLNNQIVGFKDIVNPNSNIFDEYAHGMMVLSLMGGNVSDSLVGTAPKASYLLIRSEDVNSENLIEEDNWVAAIEYADSMGVDVVNSSLGYATFDDTTIVRTFADMTGRVSRASLAATFASRRGIIVCVSAGNSAENAWHHIGTPADADSVLTVGAVNGLMGYAPFSSVGPSADGRVKPDVSTMGQGAYVQNTDGTFISGDGTSFASPILAGTVACLWQAFPNKTNFEIMDAIRHSASQFNAPDTLMGYGIPNFNTAYHALLSVDISKNTLNSRTLSLYPNPVGEHQLVMVSFTSPSYSEAELMIYNSMGKLIMKKKIDSVAMGENSFQLNGLDLLSKGVYVIKISAPSFTYNTRFIKN